jgi:two-component system sensor histidine kinase/response regulator
LLVDDNSTNLFVLREQLNQWRLRNSECASSREALVALRSACAAGDPFHIAILDHDMPDMDGEALGRAIKADPELKITLLLMLFSRAQRGDAKRMQEAGFAAYLSKPARRSDIRNALTVVWANSQHGAQPAPLVTRHSLAEAAVAPRSPLPALEMADRPRVLVVDDNAVNQLVASRMLERLGCRVDIAGDGLKALEMVTAASYDIIFMDCQMPVMDGYEATAAIRHDQPPGTHHIIVAMTAGAMQGDRERCLEAGMDDYISKPVNKSEVVAVLKRYVPARSQPGQQPAPVTQNSNN